MKQFLQYLERGFRRFVVYPVFRLLFRSQKIDSVVDLSRVRKLLILRHDRIGDMIVTTPIFRNLKRLRPNLHIGVFASPVNVDIIRHNPCVDAIFVLHSNVFQLVREIRRARRERYDVVISFVFNHTTTVALLARLAGPEALRIGHAEEKYQFYFNRLVKLPRFSVHMVESLAVYLKEIFAIELQKKDLWFEICVDETSKGSVNDFLKQNHLRRRSEPSGDFLPYILVNLSATDADRRISVAQARALAEHLSKKQNVRTVAIYAPGDREMKRAVQNKGEFDRCLVFPQQGTASLLELASLIEGAQCALTPDTAIVHFASAGQTPVLGFFTTIQGMEEWLPYQVTYDLLTAPAGQPASSIPIEQMIRQTDQFLEKLSPQMTIVPSSLPL